VNTINTIQDFRIWREKVSGSIGFVPTMGALHKGHLSLVEASNNTCQHTVVSIYLNPAQFSLGEDLNTYPKNLINDLEKLSKYDIGAIFLPTDLEMYPLNYSTYVNESKLSKVLEGKSRQSFFRGVTTVVAKLFNIICPTHAFFGEKDAQQLLIIKKMVLDLAYNIQIISCPIIREDSGLSMSSRNIYLSNKMKKSACIINNALGSAKQLLLSGERDSQTIRENIINVLKQERKLKIDYVSVADGESLNEILGEIQNQILVSTAVFIGKTRLIDNFSFSLSTNK